MRTALWPTRVCVDCRLVLAISVCPECGARSTCVEIRNDADLRLVEAALPE
ncbi:MAG: hypothetical protein ACJ790_17690 [Myxococcaceae bacterium]